MIKILFVCHGNICRSPMAEFVMKDIVRKAGISDLFEIASAATSREELGNPVYPPARRELAAHGISCAGHRAHQMTREEYAYYDYIICMDDNNIRNLKYIIGEDKEHKVSLLLSHAPEYMKKAGRRSVADPWYTDDFETTWLDVTAGCKALLDELIK